MWFLQNKNHHFCPQSCLYSFLPQRTAIALSQASNMYNMLNTSHTPYIQLSPILIDYNSQIYFVVSSPYSPQDQCVNIGMYHPSPKLFWWLFNWYPWPASFPHHPPFHSLPKHLPGTAFEKLILHSSVSTALIAPHNNSLKANLFRKAYKFSFPHFYKYLVSFQHHLLTHLHSVIQLNKALGKIPILLSTRYEQLDIEM